MDVRQGSYRDQKSSIVVFSEAAEYVDFQLLIMSAPSAVGALAESVVWSPCPDPTKPVMNYSRASSLIASSSGEVSSLSAMMMILYGYHTKCLATTIRKSELMLCWICKPKRSSQIIGYSKKALTKNTSSIPIQSILYIPIHHP